QHQESIPEKTLFELILNWMTILLIIVSTCYVIFYGITSFDIIKMEKISDNVWFGNGSIDHFKLIVDGFTDIRWRPSFGIGFLIGFGYLRKFVYFEFEFDCSWVRLMLELCYVGCWVVVGLCCCVFWFSWVWGVGLVWVRLERVVLEIKKKKIDWKKRIGSIDRGGDGIGILNKEKILQNNHLSRFIFIYFLFLYFIYLYSFLKHSSNNLMCVCLSIFFFVCLYLLVFVCAFYVLCQI
ncbi:hypothetical protein RFI_29901, partial [Reticulomyxa filosa]